MDNPFVRIAHCGTPYGQEIKTYLTDLIAGTTEVDLAGTYEIAPGGTNNSAIVASVVGYGADALFDAGYEEEGSPFTVALRESTSIPLVAADGVYLDDFIEGTTGFQTDVLVVGPKPTPDNTMA